MEAATEPGGLAGTVLEWAPQTAVTVVLASARLPGVLVERRRDQRASTACPRACSSPTRARRRDADGRIVTAGGRVLNVTALGADADAAREAAYAGADRIRFDGMQMRRDIALGKVAQ